MAPKQQEKKIVLETHSKSLYNISQAPGWNDDENRVLRLCIMKYGLGQWTRMRKLAVLPGKMITQLYLHTQRHLGQQSLGAFLNLKIDPEEVHKFNETRMKEEVGLAVKGGIILNNGENPTRESRLKKLEENRKRFQLTEEQIDEVSEIELFKVKRQKRIQFTQFLQNYLELKKQKKTVDPLLEVSWTSSKIEDEILMQESKLTEEEAKQLEAQIQEQRTKLQKMQQDYLNSIHKQQLEIQ